MSLKQRTDFSALLNPRGIAVVGASQELHRIGGQPVRNLTDLGYTGNVYPVNPKYQEIKGLLCYPDITAVPEPCDLAVIVVGAKFIPGIIEKCGKAGIRFAVILSSGFGETGDEGAQLQRELGAAIESSGVRVVGPNCVGILNLKNRMYCGMGTGFQDPNLKAGPVAMVTQSGGVGFSIVTLAERSGVGFNYVVSSGNEVDITTPDLIEYFLEQDDIHLVAVYMEGVNDGRKLIEVGRRALELGKPIVVWKSGNTKAGRQAAASHTANLTADYSLYRTVFKSGGFIEARDVTDFVDIASAYRRRRLPRGKNVAIVTTSGGAGVVLADHCEECGLILPEIPTGIVGKLRTVLPAFAAVANPLDMTAQGQNNLGLSPHNQVVKVLLEEPTIDQVIVRNGNVHGQAGVTWARELIDIAEETAKPIMVSWGIVIAGTDPIVAMLDEAGVPCYETPLRLARAMGALSDFSQKKQMLDLHTREDARLVQKCALDLPVGPGTFGENHSKKLLAEYGLPSVKGLLLSIEEIEALRRSPLKFPIAVKIESPDVPHKTEAGAVMLGVKNLADLKIASRAVLENALQYKPEAKINGLLIQEMTTGIETIVGVINDAHFGPTVMFGLGGILTELLHDVTYRFAPFDKRTAIDMIKETKAHTMLAGFRGKPVADVNAVAEYLSRISWLAADHADRIAEIDVNPVFVRAEGEGVLAADALIVLK